MHAYTRHKGYGKAAYMPSVLAFSCFLPMLVHGHVIENDSLRISFGSAENGYPVAAIENKLGEGCRFIYSDPLAPSNFWALAFSSCNATGGIDRIEIDNHVPAAAKRVERHGDETRFIWEGIDLPVGEKGVLDVTASVTLPSGAAESTWRISVANRSTRWALHSTAYPLLKSVVRPGEADVLLPHVGLGARLLRRFGGFSRNQVCCWGEYPYPSYYPMMTAFMVGGQGVLVYADDPDARMKTLWVNDLDVEFRTSVENAGVVGKAAKGPLYDVKVAAFTGDWWQVAKRYRKWALQQKWTAKGPIATRSDYPKSMFEPSLWFCKYQYQIAGFSNFFSRIHCEAPDVKFGVRWYKWHSGDMDTNFPEFLPARDGVGEVGDALCKSGYTMMPYVNARIWDTKLMSFDYAKKDVCRREDGGLYTEKWSGKPYGRHDFGIMCPVSKDWQNLVHRLAIESIAQTHCNAIYYDQIGCASPRGCCNLSHGHPLGGGSWWADGYRVMLGRAHNVFSPHNIAMTTEGTAECYMDVCDGFLATAVPTAEDVPFWTAVYSGFTTYFASRFSVSSRFENGVDFERTFPLMAREFVWGIVNCWSDDWRGEKGIDGRKCDAALGFARARQSLMEFLALGSLEAPLETVGALPPVPYTVWEAMHSRKNPKSAELPAVIGAWWRDVSRQKMALIGVNVSGETQTFRFKCPDSGSCPVVQSLSAQSRPKVYRDSSSGLVGVTVSPRTIFCLVQNNKEKKQ